VLRSFGDLPGTVRDQVTFEFAASPGKDEVERLAPSGCGPSVIVVWRQHQLQRVNDIVARFILGAALTDSARNLDDSGHDPAIFIGLFIHDREPKAAAEIHASNIELAREWALPLSAATRLTENQPLSSK
jgi:hypothetical protein